MLVEILEFTKTEVIVKEVTEKSENIFGMNINEFDVFSRMIGTTFETDGVSVPYEISSQRRQDIRDHHHEEAMCGNI